MRLLSDAQEYWVVASRFRRNKDNPAMPGVACRDMDKMLSSHGVAVRKRIIAFTTKHRPKTSSGPPDPTGPRRA